MQQSPKSNQAPATVKCDWPLSDGCAAVPCYHKQRICLGCCVVLPLHCAVLPLRAAFIGSWVSKRVGRRPAMILAGAFFLVGAVLLAAAFHVAMLILGRVIMGLGAHCTAAAAYRAISSRTSHLACACMFLCALPGLSGPKLPVGPATHTVQHKQTCIANMPELFLFLLQVLVSLSSAAPCSSQRLLPTTYVALSTPSSSCSSPLESFQLNASTTPIKTWYGAGA